jgi:uncharacterized spore protein YtfJ
MDLTEVQRDVAKRAESMPAQLVERLADRIGGVTGTAAVFGAPIEREGVTVIPVTKQRWGFGAGGGTGTAEGTAAGTGSGGGGGGGLMAEPMGYIEIAGGHAEYRPIKMKTFGETIAPALLAGGVATWLALNGLRRLFRD